MQEYEKTYAFSAILQKLYRQLALAALQTRMLTYRLFVQPEKKVDVASLLAKQIDVLAVVAARDNNYHDVKIENVPHASSSHNNADIHDRQPIRNKNVSHIESEFTKHLKEQSLSSVSYPLIGEKLVASTWEHIHSALRHARQGNVIVAKLNADIAGSALEEAAHFLNDEEYANLMFQIEQYFADEQKVLFQEM